ncbi:MAG: hypothetical protein JWO97_2842 [Acidobacteria bacterium]|nr:hypothetical protein [Acidobacteriota bacterium]
MKKATIKVPAARKAPKISVSELNVKKAAARLLTVKLVSTEISYVQRTLGNTATQDEIDAHVIAVRKMPWAEIALAD